MRMKSTTIKIRLILFFVFFLSVDRTLADTVRVHNWTVNTRLGPVGLSGFSYASDPVEAWSLTYVEKHRQFVFYFGPLGKTAVHFDGSGLAAGSSSFRIVLLASVVFLSVWWLHKRELRRQNGY